MNLVPIVFKVIDTLHQLKRLLITIDISMKFILDIHKTNKTHHQPDCDFGVPILFGRFNR